MAKVRFADPATVVKTGTLTPEGIKWNGTLYDRSDVTILPPSEPSKIIAVGYNYQDIIDDIEVPTPTQPRLFFKTPNTLVAHGGTVELPPSVDRVAYEPEIGIVMGRQCKGVSRDKALEVVEGLTAVNDLAIDDDIPDDPGAVRASGFDNANPIGPAIVPYEAVPSNPSVTFSIDGEVHHEADFSEQVFSIPKIVENVSKLITLEPGDIITSGTPIHPGFLSSGETVEIEIEGIPPLIHDVV